MNVYGVNTILVIAISMLPGLIYFIWFQKVGRRRAYRKFARNKAMGRITDWQIIIKEIERKRALGYDKVKTNGLIAFDNDINKLNQWLNSAIPALNYQKPIEIINTGHGVELVNKELMRIEYRIY